MQIHHRTTLDIFCDSHHNSVNSNSPQGKQVSSTIHQQRHSTAQSPSNMSGQESKEEKIDRVKANLPLPDDPVSGASADLQSADGRTVNVGSGGVNAKLGTDSSEGLRGPATVQSTARSEEGGFVQSPAPRNPNTDMKQVKESGKYKDPDRPEN